jgi:hypothetical protein
MRIRVQILFWHWEFFIPEDVIRSVKTPLGCTFIARLSLLLLGLFCIFVPPVLLTYENLPNRYKDLNSLGRIFPFVGIVLVAIAALGLLQVLIHAWKRSR